MTCAAHLTVAQASTLWPWPAPLLLCDLLLVNGHLHQAGGVTATTSGFAYEEGQVYAWISPCGTSGVACMQTYQACAPCSHTTVKLPERTRVRAAPACPFIPLSEMRRTAGCGLRWRPADQGTPAAVGGPCMRRTACAHLPQRSHISSATGGTASVTPTRCRSKAKAPPEDRWHGPFMAHASLGRSREGRGGEAQVCRMHDET